MPFVFFSCPALFGKGMPEVFAAKGFLTTPQTYATLSSLALMGLVFYEAKFSVFGKYFSWMMHIISIFGSLNRVWQLFVVSVFGIKIISKRPFLIFPFVFVSFIFIVIFSDVLFFSGTVTSRFEMMKLLFYFFLQQDFFTILLGDPFYDEVYFRLHDRDFNYVESGPFFILLSFGVVGFFSSIRFF